MTTDFAHTAHAQRARLAKATRLAQLALDARLGVPLVGADDEDLRELRLDLRIGSVSAETWQLAHDILLRARADDTPPTELTGSTT